VVHNGRMSRRPRPRNGQLVDSTTRLPSTAPQSVLLMPGDTSRRPLSQTALQRRGSLSSSIASMAETRTAPKSELSMPSPPNQRSHPYSFRREGRDGGIGIAGTQCFDAPSAEPSPGGRRPSLAMPGTRGGAPCEKCSALKGRLAKAEENYAKVSMPLASLATRHWRVRCLPRRRLTVCVCVCQWRGRCEALQITIHEQEQALAKRGREDEQKDPTAGTGAEDAAAAQAGAEIQQLQEQLQQAKAQAEQAAHRAAEAARAEAARIRELEGRLEDAMATAAAAAAAATSPSDRPENETGKEPATAAKTLEAGTRQQMMRKHALALQVSGCAGLVSLALRLGSGGSDGSDGRYLIVSTVIAFVMRHPLLADGGGAGAQAAGRAGQDGQRQRGPSEQAAEKRAQGQRVRGSARRGGGETAGGGLGCASLLAAKMHSSLLPVLFCSRSVPGAGGGAVSVAVNSEPS
jgi:hypothetical protein